MALKATIFKANLQVSDIDRGYYESHSLTLARHPSETDERMMVRLLAFAQHANEKLTFCTGLSDQNEPDLWQKDYTDAIGLWIEVGQPDEKRLLRACGRAEQVVVYSYGNSTDIWWEQIGRKLTRAHNLTVVKLPADSTEALAQLTERSMQIQCMIQDGQQMWTSDQGVVQIAPDIKKSPAT